MPYPELMVRPMREELTSAGFRELKSAAEVDAFMASRDTTAMLVVNSVCGCAAGQSSRRIAPNTFRGATEPTILWNRAR